ncbi:sulfur oxidation c-type cytochrome SoxX [Mameliella sediminis]|uniref:sulfur oxidation c-type cytochrome SoxX n=1 Tax=Mameliella sediminis TaxID=2836866 RepID=UPI001C459FE2|nr:sulfur oxidation c-type cytochrome SoxX [Mameliella sediminis]MBY6117020.1 sulfur oxidation c-type cytochrome SoxX [Antarctobacter heliothermus]MBY6146773.1 sulfur oxidation c-type cytochrome SoxX [Mameliella alba]MBV7396344.1 sulfur oxidation c-type cytochrome SoxX [Mameliella sediminis]MBY6160756.1 sulfur oxidation c-type cytochrome SoxX [Mameliella alba]MBY6169226.1 sulfur oxidation c-type cytochrome SoxX [Mameliella alba]
MRLKAITAAAILVAGAAVADTVAPGDVQYGEYGEVAASLTGVDGDVDNGRVVFSSKSKGNCVACHAVAQLPDVPFQGEVGPELTWTGEARSAEELRGILANAKMTFPETVMPAFYKTSGFTRPGDGYTGKAAPADLAPILSAQEIEDVVAFLLTLKDS